MILVIIKPDAVKKGLIGPLLSAYETKFGPRSIVRAEIRKPSEWFWRQHYREHVNKDFFPSLLEHMMSHRVFAFIVGADPVAARQYTLELRERFGADKSGPANLLHASTAGDSLYEMDLWFPGQVQ